MDLDLEHLGHLPVLELDGAFPALIVVRAVRRHVLRAPPDRHFAVGTVGALDRDERLARALFEQQTRLRELERPRL